MVLLVGNDGVVYDRSCYGPKFEESSSRWYWQQLLLALHRSDWIWWIDMGLTDQHYRPWLWIRRGVEASGGAGVTAWFYWSRDGVD